MKGRSKTIAFALVLIVAAFIYLISLGMKEGSMYYLEVSELFEQLDDLGDRKVRVNGAVVEGSVNFDTEKFKLNFSIKDIEGPRKLDVIYNGTPPDLLEQEGVTLVAEGAYNRERGIFEAKKLLVKCPSKYEKKESEV